MPRKATKRGAKVPEVSGPKEKQRKTGKTVVNGPEESEALEVKTFILKGKVPVDEACSAKVGVAHVFDDGQHVYNAMLNQTNLEYNNNKYYILQLLEDDHQKAYSVWFRWGRVGKKGQSSLVSCGGNLEAAKSAFKKKFFEKTKNLFEERGNFKKVPGKYDILQMSYADEKGTDDIDGPPIQEPAKVLESKLAIQVQNLIQLICDIRAMEEAVLEMKYNTKKAPLGKLTAEQITAGYSALQTISDCIQDNSKRNDLIAACNVFYTRIPHDFGMKVPPVIGTIQEIKAKILLLEALSDIRIALKMMDGENENENVIDQRYHALKCLLNPLNADSSDYKIVDKFLKNTHAAAHNQYTLDIVDIFECSRHGEGDNFLDLGNRMLLWHGSRLTNWAGILGQGLRIAPPEAPVTGYMFGKGVYFADACSKSANYCFATRTKKEGLLLLSEVSLGNSLELVHADYNADKLPPEKHSVKGLGKYHPDPGLDEYMSNGTKVPLGTLITSSARNANSYSLNFNEYIVYNPRQIRMKYLVRVKFNY